MELFIHFAHTPVDDVNLVDYAKIVEISTALRDVIERLKRTNTNRSNSLVFSSGGGLG
jgi:hypothetical protein